MKKAYKIFITNILSIICLISTGTAQVQLPLTARAFVSAGGTSVNTYAAVGQPFFEQVNGNGYEIAYGVAQSQLDLIEREDETCINEPYMNYGYDFPANSLPEGTSTFEQYSHNVQEIFGYDRMERLNLSVWPVYEVESNETFILPLPIIDGSQLKDGNDYQLVEGDNTIIYLTVHGCDSVVHLYVTSCPHIVKDADSIEYNVIILDNYCWTQSNLKTTHYFGDSHVEVPKALIYTPGEDVNEEIYGRLYTWYSAFNVPEGSSDSPALDEDGFIRGICPAGWHIPATPEMAALESHSADEIHSPDLWIYGAGANTTGFTLRPAGYFNASTNRFEGLHTDARLWKATDTGTTVNEVEAYSSSYYCDTPRIIIITKNASDANSVRCVKNY